MGLNLGKTLVYLPFLILWSAGITASPAIGDECVVFLHGLARTSSSMEDIANAFQEQGYVVANVDYPSRDHPVEELVGIAINAGIQRCPSEATVHFVTHSLAGILVRYYLANEDFVRLGRVVMLAPPNGGSEVVDDYKSIPGFDLINGPAGSQLGTGEDSIPSKLGPVHFELGVIAGTRTLNPVLSQSLPNPDDGKVSVSRTKVEGMADFLALPYTHTFIMSADEVIEQSIYFVKNGRFRRDEKRQTR